MTFRRFQTMFVALAMSSVAVLLGREITRYSLATAFANRDPNWTLSLDPGNSQAILNRIDERLGLRAPSSEDAAKSQVPRETDAMKARIANIRARGVPSPILPLELDPVERDGLKRQADVALIVNPLSTRALRVLGQIAPDELSALVIMRKAAARSMHEAMPNYWLMQDALLAGDFERATHFANVLMRTQPQMNGYVVPVMARIAELPDGAPAVRALLRTNPPYRWIFFNALMTSRIDPRIPLDLLLDLQLAGSDPTKDEIALYIAALMKQKLYDLAYYAFLQFVPPEQLESQSFLFNGRFRNAPSGLPFDWAFTHLGGMRLEIIDAPQRPDARALQIEFIEGQANGGAQQIVVLPAGTYRLSGEWLGAIRGPRGMVWRVACLELRDTPIGESEEILGNTQEWRPFAMIFTVPESGCEAQRIWLELDARSESDRLVTGTLWFMTLDIASAP